MNRTAGPHEPTPEFRLRLEREIRRQFRDESFTPIPLREDRWRRRVRMAALVLVALGTGALGPVLSAQVQDSRQRDRLLAAEQVDLEITARRAEIARNRAAIARQRYEVGVTSRESLAAADAEVRAMETALERARLNVEEIRATARPPRDDLAAPLVDRRDFVTERMQLELAAAQEQLVAAEAAASTAEVRHRVGQIEELPLLEAQADLGRARSNLERLVGRIDLRARFFADNLDPAEVARQGERLDLLHQLRNVEDLHRIADTRVTRLRAMRMTGRVQEIELLRAELDASERAAELQRIRTYMEILETARP